MARLTVLTWNLWGKRPASVGLPDVLARFDPDLLFLQEADGPALRSEPALAPWLAHAHLDATAGTAPGMAILGRLRLRDTAAPPAGGSWDRPRVLTARVQPGEGELLAVCVHAKAPLPIPFLHAGDRNRQLAALAEWLAERTAAGQRIVAAGDFNAVSLRLDGLVDAAVALGKPAATWRPLGEPRLPALLRLDRVFLSPDLRPTAAIVPCGLSRSDHCPLIVTLEL